jgi:hypothetical protein
MNRLKLSSEIVREEFSHVINGVAGRMFNVIRWTGQLTTLASQTFGATRFYNENGRKMRMRVELRFDDNCQNGHDDFGITCSIDEERSGFWRESGGGAAHGDIVKHFPEFAPLIKWHLCGTAGPMHYLANTVYHASNRDSSGLLKGERRQIVNGKTKLPAWERVALDKDGFEIALYQIPKQVDSAEQPEDDGLQLVWRPWCRVGEGKERQLDLARSSAVWPEATDEELCAPPEELKAKLAARLPGLIEQFRSDMIACGFIYGGEDNAL